MFSKAYIDRFPETAAAVEAMIVASPPVENKAAAIQAELQKRNQTDPAGDVEFAAIWAKLAESEALFAERTAQAYHYLGINDEVRTFVGSIWAAAFRRWSAGSQLSFLKRLCTTDSIIPDIAFQFAPPVFPELRVTAEDLLPWLQQLRPQGSAPQFPHHIHLCMQSFAFAQPVEATKLCELWLQSPADEPTANLLSRTIHWIRESPRAGDPGARQARDTLEQGLADSDESSHRALLIESWGFSAASSELDEAKAVRLRDQLVSGGAEETRAWSFLLAQVVAGAPAKCKWAHRELVKLVTPNTAVPVRYWIAISAMDGWAKVTEENLVSRDEWESLLFSLAPLGPAEGGIWQRIEYFLVDVFGQDTASGQRLLVRLAESSGSALAGLLDDGRRAFAWLCQNLQQGGHAERVVTELCFSSHRGARMAGLRLFERCSLNTLGAGRVAVADAGEIERFLLEAVLRFGDYPRLARLHICFAAQVDQLGGPLAEWFYDEVKTQALNTNKYRQEIVAHGGSLARLRACIDAATIEIEASAKVGQSPALKMQIPGRDRAERMAIRRMGREIAKNIDKYSVFLQLIPKVQLLYGRNWRMRDQAGKITPASALAKSEVSMEMPRLEFITPEAMRQRRLLAIRRISELDQNAAKDLV